jgi:hypothetical protein
VNVKLLSPTFAVEYVLRVFEKRVLRKTFWPNRDEVMGERRKRYEKFHDILSSLRGIKATK